MGMRGELTDEGIERFESYVFYVDVFLPHSHPRAGVLGACLRVCYCFFSWMYFSLFFLPKFFSLGSLEARVIRVLVHIEAIRASKRHRLFSSSMKFSGCWAAIFKASWRSSMLVLSISMFFDRGRFSINFEYFLSSLIPFAL